MSLDKQKRQRGQIDNAQSLGKPRKSNANISPAQRTSTVDGTSPQAHMESAAAARGQKRKRKSTREQTAESARKRQKSAREDAETQVSARSGVLNGRGASSGPLSKRSKRSRNAAGRSHGSWTLSRSVGGRFLPVDPVFSDDEQYLFLTTRHSLSVYSTKTSLLYRRVDLSTHGSIACLTKSTAKSELVYVGTATGHLVEVDWQSGVVVNNKKIGANISAIATCKSRGSDAETIYFLDATGNHSQKVGTKVCRLSSDETKVLLDVSKPVRDFRVLSDGSVVIAASDRHVFLGLLNIGTNVDQEARSVWHQVESTDPIVSIDARERTAHNPSKSASKGSIHLAKIDLAIGTIHGAIHIHEDFIAKLTGSGVGKQGINSSARPVPRTLHWHRGPVHSLKWSLDGNYLISGGMETVLALWQMRTGKRQDLPHLSSAIDCLTVSPSGATYAVQLADNSIILLSTAELQATAHISGLQTRLAPPGGQSRAPLRTVSSEQAKEWAELEANDAIVSVVHPLRTNELLLAVPASQPKTSLLGTSKSAPFLQTYDLSAAHIISRQALTRNNVTSLATGPEANQIGEPDLRFMQVSYDGNWLATVEEWFPPHPDLDFASSDRLEVLEERNVRAEIYLKFWKWNADVGVWSLDTRIDAPHTFLDSMTPARIQCLAADPQKAEFVTSGEDGVLKIWQCSSRYRHEVAVRGQKGERLTVWSCRVSLNLESAILNIEDGALNDSGAIISRVAYSEDGSVLAACYEDTTKESTGMVRLISTSSGEVVQSRPDLDLYALQGVGILGRYLIVVSSSLIVFDLVDDELSYQHDIHHFGYGTSAAPKLAVNAQSGTFALVVPAKRSGHSKVLIFDPSNPVPIYTSPRLEFITAILSMPKLEGYVLLNRYAEAKTLCLSSSVSLPIIKDASTKGDATTASVDRTAEPLGEPELQVGMEQLGDAHVSDEDSEVADESEEDSEDESTGKPVVRPQHLASLFEDSPSYAMPPVKDMFDAILGLYARKPSHKATNA